MSWRLRSLFRTKFSASSPIYRLVPAFASFQRYHLEHHRYQGENGIDTDIPTEWEARFFRTTFRKVLWCLMQPFFYAFRPLLTLPKVPKMFEILNLVVVAAFD